MTPAEPPASRPPPTTVRPWVPPEIKPHVHPSRPGHGWWTYRRLPGPPLTTGPGEVGDHPLGVDPIEAPPSSAADPEQVEIPEAARSPRIPAALGAALFVSAVIVARAGVDGAGGYLLVVAGICIAMAIGRHVARTRPTEHWVGSFLVLGVAVKVTASLFRYRTIVDSYEGVADASVYDDFGVRFANAWNGNGFAPDLADRTDTNFIRWFTGVVYYVFGIDMVTGFIVFGLLALIGSYLWYRATVQAVPFLDKRLYLALVLFMPSIAFWPSSIGKEALMQLGIGAMAVATSLLMRGVLARGLVVGLAGGWLVWVVRPHLLALVTFAGACAYILGRVQNQRRGASSLLARPVGMLVVGFLLVFTVSAGAEFLEIDELSLSSIEEELDEQTERSSQGGSQFETADNSLNPIHLPEGAVTVLFRPFPWETESGLQLLAAFEGFLLALAMVWRFSSLRAALRRSRTHAFLLYCWILTALYAATFSSFANFGLLVRQRSLVLPAVLVLLAVDVAQSKRPDPADPELPSGSPDAASPSVRAGDRPLLSRR